MFILLSFFLRTVFRRDRRRRRGDDAETGDDDDDSTGDDDETGDDVHRDDWRKLSSVMSSRFCFSTLFSVLISLTANTRLVSKLSPED
jgi:hypothetical protein